MGVCVLCLFLMVLSAAGGGGGGVYYVGLGHFFISKFELKYLYFWVFFRKISFFLGGGRGEDFVAIFEVITKMV